MAPGIFVYEMLFRAQRYNLGAVVVVVLVLVSLVIVPCLARQQWGMATAIAPAPASAPHRRKGRGFGPCVVIARLLLATLFPSPRCT